MNKEITVAANREQIPAITEFIRDVMTFAGFDLKKTMEVMLAVEEACTNIALYAYDGRGGTIHITVRRDKDRMVLIIEDWGVPFDPTAHRTILSDADAEDRPIGGLGIHLIKSYVDGISYQFVDGKNTLKLIKNIY
jgi:anti-sigma regulatory factor (Ser/Thr protein kinase)